MGLLDTVSGGVLGLVGGLIQNDQNKENVSSANQAARNAAGEQMAFQEKMSNTAYQRSTADMRKAGINPMLAGLNQSQASTPTGASPNISAAHAENAIGQGISSAIDARRLRKEIDATDSQVDLNRSLATTQAAQTKLNEASARVAAKNEESLSAQMPAIKANARAERARSEIDEKMAVPDAINNRLNTATGTIGNVMDLFKPWLKQGPQAPQGRVRNPFSKAPVAIPPGWSGNHDLP